MSGYELRGTRSGNPDGAEGPPRHSLQTGQGRQIPAFKIGSDWRFQKDQVVHWIAEQTIGAAQ
jgi:hypothetical protein